VSEDRPVDREPIRAYLARMIGGERDLLPPDHESLVDAGILDSFGLADLIGMIERQYGVKVPDKDASMRSFESVDKIADYVARRRDA
jgi:acyl carrier protein